MTTAWRFHEVEPGADPDSLPASTCGVVLLTGCGLVGLWSPREGITRLTAPGSGGEVPLPRVEVEGVTRPVAARGSGSGALRVLEGEGGVRVLEEVVLRDGVPGLLLRWSISGTGGPAGPESGGGAAEAGVVHLVLHRGDDMEVDRIAITPSRPVARLFHPEVSGPAPGRGSFRAQARRRSSRASLDPEPLAVWAAGPAVPPGLEARIAGAVHALDDASLQEDAEGGALPPFILGMEDGVPVMAGGTPLVELGLGALASGRFSLAGAILRTLLEGGGAPPLPLLVLAAEWGGWTGETGLLLEGRSALETALAQLRSGGSAPSGEPPPHGRSFPDPPSALEALASAMEPLGDRGWTEELKGAASAIRAGAGGGRKVLPVLGSTPPVQDGWPVLLPPVEGFGHPDDPGLLPRRMLHSARLLRAVSQGLLGIQPEVPWGRIRLAPRLPEGWEHLRAIGIRVGDTSLRLEVTAAAGGVEFELTPAAGRIPLNLVFEPELPLAGVGRVLLSGEVVEVDVLPGPPGRTGIRFQFPLDERKVVRVEPG